MSTTDGSITTAAPTTAPQLQPPNRAAEYRIGPAPIAEPEEVTDVSVQASIISLNQTAGPGTATRDEPDVQIRLGRDRMFPGVRDLLAGRPFSSLGRNIRRKPWWPGGRGGDRRGSRPEQNGGPDRSPASSSTASAAFRRFRHRFCPPFRVVAEEDASVAHESESVVADSIVY